MHFRRDFERCMSAGPSLSRFPQRALTGKNLAGAGYFGCMA